jgi:hypothetical protein
VSRYLVGSLRVLAALGAGAAAWATLWLIRGGEPGSIAYVASLAAALVVYVAAASPMPKPWAAPQKMPEPLDPAPAGD